MNSEQKANTLEILALHKQNEEFNAINVCRLYQKLLADYIDWHEFSDYLSTLHTKKLLKVEGIDINGMTIYTWNKGE